MRYIATYKGEERTFNFQENYEPLDFVRNNEDVDLFTKNSKNNGKIEIDYELVIRLMSECYADMLKENYL